MCKPLFERSAKAKDIGSKIQICTKQPRNLKTILGGYREKTRVSQNVPANAGCSKCVNSAHARPSTQPTIDVSGNFPPHVSVSPNQSEVLEP